MGEVTEKSVLIGFLTETLKAKDVYAFSQEYKRSELAYMYEVLHGEPPAPKMRTRLELALWIKICVWEQLGKGIPW